MHIPFLFLLTCLDVFADRLVGMMGGRIWLKSQVGKGSTFYFIACFNRGHPDCCKQGHEKPDIASMGEGYLQKYTSPETMIHYTKKTDWRKLSEVPSTVQANAFSENNESMLNVSANDVLLHDLGQRQRQESYIWKSSDIITTNNPDEQMPTNIATNGTNENIVRGLNILLAEDNLVNQKVACQQLKKFGTEVDVVCDGEQCLKVLSMNRDKYDLILMDVQVIKYDSYPNVLYSPN